MNKTEFLNKYPVTLSELLVTPMVFKEHSPVLADLPPPRLAHIKDICLFAGFSYGAVRTALSRARKRGEIQEFEDDDDVRRFCLTEYQRDVGAIASEDVSKTDSFSLAVFSFQTHEEAARRSARDLLQYFGFQYFAQNVYISRRINRAPFESALRAKGLENNLFLFDCNDPGSKEFKEKLYTQFEMEKNIKKLNEFKADVSTFVSSTDDDVELARRVVYLGPVHYIVCFRDAPPLPQNYFPIGYPMLEMKQLFGDLPRRVWQSVREYYVLIEETGEKQ